MKRWPNSFGRKFQGRLKTLRVWSASRSGQRVIFGLVSAMILVSAVVVFVKASKRPVICSLDLLPWQSYFAELGNAGPVPVELRRKLKRANQELSEDARIFRSYIHGVDAEIASGNEHYYVKHHGTHVCVYSGFNVNAPLMAQVTLGAALLFTWLLTVWQYVFGRSESGTPLRHAFSDLGELSLHLVLLILGGGFVLICVDADLLLDPFEGRLYRIGPAAKNMLVFLVALLFIKIDGDIVREEMAERHLLSADWAIAWTVAVSSLFIAVLGPDLLSSDFVHAYNVGLLSFHMVLGVLLAWFGTGGSHRGARGPKIAVEESNG